jgi:single-strand DNA-binding protein
MGNLTRDVELRVTPKGTAIAQFGLAINRKWKDEGGQEREEVTFIDCEAWAKSAETLAKFVGKGSPLYVSGRLKLDQWEDKNTKEKRSKLKVVVEQFQFLGGDKPSAPKAPPAQQAKAQAQAPANEMEDDVGF